MPGDISESALILPPHLVDDAPLPGSVAGTPDIVLQKPEFPLAESGRSTIEAPKELRPDRILPIRLVGLVMNDRQRRRRRGRIDHELWLAGAPSEPVGKKETSAKPKEES